MNPIEVDQRLEETADLVLELADEMEGVSIESAEAAHSYRRALARTRLLIREEMSGMPRITVDEVEDRALLRVEADHRRHLVAEALHDAKRDRLFAARAALDAYRTLSASVREAVR